MFLSFLVWCKRLWGCLYRTSQSSECQICLIFTFRPPHAHVLALFSFFSSQWTGMLDLLEVPLSRGQYGYRRLDGTLSVAAREKAITDFEERPEVMVLLVSLKAAALGVNLVSGRKRIENQCK